MHQLFYVFFYSYFVGGGSTVWSSDAASVNRL